MWNLIFVHWFVPTHGAAIPRYLTCYCTLLLPFSFFFFLYWYFSLELHFNLISPAIFYFLSLSWLLLLVAFCISFLFFFALSSHSIPFISIRTADKRIRILYFSPVPILSFPPPPPPAAIIHVPLPHTHPPAMTQTSTPDKAIRSFTEASVTEGKRGQINRYITKSRVKAYLNRVFTEISRELYGVAASRRRRGKCGYEETVWGFRVFLREWTSRKN